MIVKGLRVASDAEAELQQAQMNKAVAGSRPSSSRAVGVLVHRLQVRAGLRPLRRGRPDRLDWCPEPVFVQLKEKFAMSDDRTSASEPVDTETLLRRVIEIIGGTRTLPLSSSVKLDNKEEVLELLEEAMARLPEEIRQARWMMKEREEYLAQDAAGGRGHPRSRPDAGRAHGAAHRDRPRGPATPPAGSSRTAEDEARRLRLEAEDYCDQKLAAFEIVLDRTLKTVHAGREKLSVTPPPTVNGPDAGIAGVDLTDDTLAGEDAFFDQDRGSPSGPGLPVRWFRRPGPSAPRDRLFKMPANPFLVPITSLRRTPGARREEHRHGVLPPAELDSASLGQRGHRHGCARGIGDRGRRRPRGGRRRDRRRRRGAGTVARGVPAVPAPGGRRPGRRRPGAVPPPPIRGGRRGRGDLPAGQRPPRPRPFTRDAVLLELPLAPLCRPDCAGLCPTCGADLNEGPCACPPAEGDPRWAALDALRSSGSGGTGPGGAGDVWGN